MGPPPMAYGPRGPEDFTKHLGLAVGLGLGLAALILSFVFLPLYGWPCLVVMAIAGLIVAELGFRLWRSIFK
jgi:hypothetical protein